MNKFNKIIVAVLAISTLSPMVASQKKTNDFKETQKAFNNVANEQGKLIDGMKDTKVPKNNGNKTSKVELGWLERQQQKVTDAKNDVVNKLTSPKVVVPAVLLTVGSIAYTIYLRQSNVHKKAAQAAQMYLQEISDGNKQTMDFENRKFASYFANTKNYSWANDMESYLKQHALILKTENQRTNMIKAIDAEIQEIVDHIDAIESYISKSKVLPNISYALPFVSRLQPKMLSGEAKKDLGLSKRVNNTLNALELTKVDNKLREKNSIWPALKTDKPDASFLARMSTMVGNIFRRIVYPVTLVHNMFTNAGYDIKKTQSNYWKLQKIHAGLLRMKDTINTMQVMGANTVVVNNYQGQPIQNQQLQYPQLHQYWQGK